MIRSRTRGDNIIDKNNILRDFRKTIPYSKGICFICKTRYAFEIGLSWTIGCLQDISIRNVQFFRQSFCNQLHMIESADQVSTPMHGSRNNTPIFIFRRMKSSVLKNLEIILHQNIEIFSIRLVFILLNALFRVSIFTRDPHFIEKTFLQIISIMFCEILHSHMRLYMSLFIDKYTPENVSDSSEHRTMTYDITFSRISLTPGEVCASWRSDSIKGFMRDCDTSSTNS